MGSEPADCRLAEEWGRDFGAASLAHPVDCEGV